MLTTDAMDRALAAVFAGPLRMGLLAGDVELKDANYERQPIVLSEPSGTDGRGMTNVAEVRFPPLAADMARDLTGWFIADGSGTVLDRDRLARPRRLEAGEAAVFRVGDVKVRFVAGRGD